jgi:hypothetical protein
MPRLTGNAAILLHICPELLRTPAGRSSGATTIVDLNDLTYLLGRVASLEPEVLDLRLNRFTVYATRLGTMLDLLLNPADGDSDISERRRPAQLRAWLERRRDAKVETGRVGPEDFTLGKEDLVELELMRPPALELPEADPAVEAGFDLFGARGGMGSRLASPQIRAAAPVRGWTSRRRLESHLHSGRGGGRLPHLGGGGPRPAKRSKRL